jgi:putative transposase
VTTTSGRKRPKGKHFTADQIIVKLRGDEVLLAEGKTVADVVREIEVMEQTFYWWQREEGRLRTDQANRLKRPRDEERPPEATFR